MLKEGQLLDGFIVVALQLDGNVLAQGSAFISSWSRQVSLARTCLVISMTVWTWSKFKLQSCLLSTAARQDEVGLESLKQGDYGPKTAKLAYIHLI